MPVGLWRVESEEGRTLEQGAGDTFGRELRGNIEMQTLGSNAESGWMV